MLVYINYITKLLNIITNLYIIKYKNTIINNIINNLNLNINTTITNFDINLIKPYIDCAMDDFRFIKTINIDYKNNNLIWLDSILTNLDKLIKNHY